MSFEAIEKILICPYKVYPSVEHLLDRIGIKICSYDITSCSSFDMYVLSESSMIIDKSRRILILQTCGQSKLIDILGLIGEKDSFYYYHRPYMFPDRQPYHYQTITDEKEYLIQVSQREPNIQIHDCGTVEMWGVRNPKIQFQYEVIHIEVENLKDNMDIREFLKGIGISYRDHVFTPTGYSINVRLDSEHWMTVHISPPEGVLTVFSNHEVMFKRFVSFVLNRM